MKFLIFILVILVLTIIGLFLNIQNKYNTNGEELVIFILGMSISLIIFLIISEIYNEPCALDVYRGKTEIEIHTINGVPQDTVVVWKGGKQ